MSRRVTLACLQHSRCLTHLAFESRSSHIQTLDSDISRTKAFLFSIFPSVIRQDIIQFIRMLNSKLYSFLQESRIASKFNLLLGNHPVSALLLTDSEWAIPAKGLKFVPNPGSLNIYSVKQDHTSFFRRLILRHNHILIINPQSTKRTYLRPSVHKNLHALPQKSNMGL